MPNPFETNRTINPQNWVSNAASINIDPKTNTVKVHGETLTLKQGVPIFGDPVKTKFDFHSIKVEWDGREFVTLSRFGDDDRWECVSGDIVRDAKCPFELAAIMACNLI